MIKCIEELLIDNPNNKSGFQQFPQYPIFNSNESSFVYYDASSIFNGIYKRDSFYFRLEPFTIMPFSCKSLSSSKNENP